MKRARPKPRQLLDVFVNLSNIAADVAESFEGLGGDVGRRARDAATRFRQAAGAGVAAARAADRLLLEREALAARLRREADEIESAPGMHEATINGERVPLTVVEEPKKGRRR